MGTEGSEDSGKEHEPVPRACCGQRGLPADHGAPPQRGHSGPQDSPPLPTSPEPAHLPFADLTCLCLPRKQIFQQNLIKFPPSTQDDAYQKW